MLTTSKPTIYRIEIKLKLGQVRFCVLYKCINKHKMCSWNNALGFMYIDKVFYTSAKVTSIKKLYEKRMKAEYKRMGNDRKL